MIARIEDAASAPMSDAIIGSAVSMIEVSSVALHTPIATATNAGPFASRVDLF